jgi:hypothetical protein
VSEGGNGDKDLQAIGLDQIAKGITLTLAELREFGIDSLAGVGRGFSELQLSGLELGEGELTSAFTSFCDRWEWGVRTLVAEGNDFAEGVHLSAGTYYETEPVRRRRYQGRRELGGGQPVRHRGRGHADGLGRAGPQQRAGEP